MPSTSAGMSLHGPGAPRWTSGGPPSRARAALTDATRSTDGTASISWRAVAEAEPRDRSGRAAGGDRQLEVGALRAVDLDGEHAGGLVPHRDDRDAGGGRAIEDELLGRDEEPAAQHRGTRARHRLELEDGAGGDEHQRVTLAVHRRRDADGDRLLAGERGPHLVDVARGPPPSGRRGRRACGRCGCGPAGAASRRPRAARAGRAPARARGCRPWPTHHRATQSSAGSNRNGPRISARRWIAPSNRSGSRVAIA